MKLADYPPQKPLSEGQTSSQPPAKKGCGWAGSEGGGSRRRRSTEYSQCNVALAQQCLNFLPDPHGHSTLRPTLGASRRKVVAERRGHGRRPNPGQDVEFGEEQSGGVRATS